MSRFLATFSCDNESLQVEFYSVTDTTVELQKTAEAALMAKYPEDEPLIRAILIMSELKVEKV